MLKQEETGKIGRVRWDDVFKSTLSCFRGSGLFNLSPFFDILAYFRIAVTGQISRDVSHLWETNVESVFSHSLEHLHFYFGWPNNVPKCSFVSQFSLKNELLPESRYLFQLLI